MNIGELAAIVIACYLLGAVPFGLVAGKLWGVDVRDYGSGKIGATNVLRTLGLRVAAAVFALDLAKGIIAVLLARFVLESGAGEVAAALAAIAGHDWSVYIRFRGGRGVTTSLGALLAMTPLAAAISLVTFGVVVALSRYVSLGSILAATSAVVAIVLFAILDRLPAVYLVYGLVAGGLIVLQHRDNIGRLLSGSERRLGERGERRPG